MQNTDQPVTYPAWTIKQLAEFLRLKPNTLYKRRLTDPDALPPTRKISGRLYYDQVDIADWLDARTRDGESEVGENAPRMRLQ